MKPKFILLLGHQGWFLQRLGSLLKRVGVWITSRDHPVGSYSAVPIEVHYRSLEALNRLVLEMPSLGALPERFAVSGLDQDSLRRLQRQRFHQAFTYEWTFARMVAFGYPDTPRWDLTIANPAMRTSRRRAVSRYWAFRTLFRVLKGTWVSLRGPSQKTGSPKRIHLVWGGISPIEMQADPEKLSLPHFLRELAWELKMDPSSIWLVGYGNLEGPLDPLPTSIPPLAPPAMFRLLLKALRDLWGACLDSSGGIESLTLAEDAMVAWSKAWLSRFSSSCAVGTLGEIACDAPWVVASRILGRSACFVAYASLNVPSAKGAPWDDLEPGYRYSLYSHYILWSESIAQFFRRYAQPGAQVLVSGPVMFAPNAPNGPAAERGRPLERAAFRLGIFDISPHADSLLSLLGLGAGWYTLKDVEAFYNDIFLALRRLHPDGVQGRAVEVLIKPKRFPRDEQVVPGYAQFLEKLAEEAPFPVRQLGQRENPWLLFSRMDAVISIPFTSSTSVGRALGIPSVYYAASPEVAPGEHTMDGNCLLRGPVALEDWLQRVFENGVDLPLPREIGSQALARCMAGPLGFPTEKEEALLTSGAGR
ncbi:MAG: hypothetical protein HYZ90_01215 [Candidatus Omnitrophica bacterium]|nr:hypothetical protein [Candidatus Omnitrophota bacterium]